MQSLNNHHYANRCTECHRSSIKCSRADINSSCDRCNQLGIACINRLKFSGKTCLYCKEKHVKCLRENADGSCERYSLLGLNCLNISKKPTLSLPALHIQVNTLRLKNQFVDAPENEIKQRLIAQKANNPKLDIHIFAEGPKEDILTLYICYSKKAKLSKLYVQYIPHEGFQLVEWPSSSQRVLPEICRNFASLFLKLTGNYRLKNSLLNLEAKAITTHNPLCPLEPLPLLNEPEIPVDPNLQTCEESKPIDLPFELVEMWKTEHFFS